MIIADSHSHVPTSLAAFLAARRALLLPLFVVVAIAAAGCPGCGSDAATFCIEAAKVQCQLQYRCCTAQERQAFFGNVNLSIGPYHDEGGCVDAFTRQCEAASQAQDEAIAAGRVAFDEDRANACLNTRRTAVGTCDADTIFNFDENCTDLFSGQVADGDVCFASSECAERGSTCEVEQDLEPDGTFVVRIEGTCKGQGDDGEPCLPGDQCNGELVCVQDPITFESECTARGGPGAPCDTFDGNADCQDGLRCEFDVDANRCVAPAQQGEACDFDDDCAEGLSCVQDANFNTVCGVRGGLGSFCSSDEQCANGLICAPDPDNFNNVCSSTSGAGEPCTAGDAQCQPGLDCRNDPLSGQQLCFAGVLNDPCDGFGDRCVTGLLCLFNAAAGRTQCSSPLGEGITCEQFTPENCDPNLRCIDDDGDFNFTCEDPLPPSAPCDEFASVDPCNATHRCRFDATAAADICVPRLAAGATCAQDTDCTSGTYCDFVQDRCTALKAENQACSDDRECSGNLECRFNDAGNTQICRSLSVEGSGCEELADCAAGLDCRGNDLGRLVCLGAADLDESCENQGDCAAGLDCRPNEDFENVCRGLSGQNQSCEDQLDCDAGLQCRFDNVTFTERCLGLGAAGDACANDIDCVDGLVCRFNNASGTNVCTELIAVNQPCPFEFQDGDCQAGLRCRDVLDTDEPICTDKVDDFEPCEDDTDCLSSFCDPDDQICSEEPPEVDFEVCNGLN